MKKKLTSKRSRQTKTTAQRSVNRRVRPNQSAGTASKIPVSTSTRRRLLKTTAQRSVNRRVRPNQSAGMPSRIPVSTSTRRPRFNMNRPLYQNKGDYNSTPTTGQQNFAAGTERRLQAPKRTVYDDGYTVISPNEKKRQKIIEMAQRETWAYEQYKQANAVKYVSHVGRVGGGEITVEQVRKEQERAVKKQKLDRLKRQEEHRNSRKKVEEVEIEKKKAEARRKAEQNAIRNGKVPQTEQNAVRNGEVPSPEEIRRKREAFLRQIWHQ